MDGAKRYPSVGCRGGDGIRGAQPILRIDDKTGSSDLPVRLFLGLSSFISDFPKNISIPTYPKSPLELLASHPTEGRIAIVTDAGRGAVDAAALGAQRGCRAGWRKARERSNGELTNDVAAYGEVVWS
jgi:N-acetylmuramoyl-L-alanine amidase